MYLAINIGDKYRGLICRAHWVLSKMVLDCSKITFLIKNYRISHHLINIPNNDNYLTLVINDNEENVAFAILCGLTLHEVRDNNKEPQLINFLFNEK